MVYVTDLNRNIPPREGEPAGSLCNVNDNNIDNDDNNNNDDDNNNNNDNRPYKAH